MDQLNRLREILENNKIEYVDKTVVSTNDGIDINYKDFDISVVSHQYSYGGKQGLLEIMASFIENSVKGWLTAEQVYEIIKTNNILNREEKNMPTENMKFGPGMILFKDQEGNIKELCNYECKDENCDDSADAMRYYAESLQEETTVTAEIDRASLRRLKKMYGLETITRKRFIKLLMGCRMQRNDAEIIAESFHRNKIRYTPLAVQQVIETIINEMEK